MNKYFTKEESENIITLLKSSDIESIRLGFTLLRTHPKFKNFKKLIPYNESRIYFYKKIGVHYTTKNNLSEEMNVLYNWFLRSKYIPESFYYQSICLINFIKKRTK